MRLNFTLCFVTLIVSFVNAQPPGEWMWIHGDSAINQVGNFGVQGIHSPSNNPPALYEACEWTDLNGNFWMFGGATYSTPSFWPASAALCKYDPYINEWTWMNGPTTLQAPGVYGTQGIPSSSNYPPSRSWGTASWTDLQGNLWLFGGSRLSIGTYCDLWRYNIATNEWTWMKGPSSPNHPGVYGTQGIPSSSNYPASRYESAAAWVDDSGDLWLFGGSVRNDLWKYNIATNTWTWMKGSALGNQPGVYGTQGIEATANTPGGRLVYAHWKDNTGKLWLFGGSTLSPQYYFNDLWCYNPLTNNWAWINGSSSTNSFGNSGVKCMTSSLNVPSARFENRCSIVDKNGNFWMFGGGKDNGRLNDLWMYCIDNNLWTWVNGGNGYNSTGNWGSLNVPSPNNTPNGRIGSVGWYDNNGHIYIFGGNNSTLTMQNDLWRFTIDYNCGKHCDPLALNVSSKNMNSEIDMYPNPTTSTLTLETNSANPLHQIIIYSADGREIKTVNCQLSTVNLDVSDLSAGIYFFNCIGEKGSEMVKVVKY